MALTAFVVISINPQSNPMLCKSYYSANATDEEMKCLEKLRDLPKQVSSRTGIFNPFSP